MSVGQLIDEVSNLGVVLWVEGSRLRFRGPRGALSDEQRAALSTRRAEVNALLRERAAASTSSAPLSHNQRALWFVAQEASSSAAYNLAAASRITSRLDPAAFRDALQGLTDRHPMLRTTYQLGDDSLPVQRTLGSVAVSFELHDAHGLSDSELHQRVTADYRRPFDLENGPVFRASLYSRAPDEHVFLMVVHHIAADAWSLGILADDLRSLYLEARGGNEAVAPRPAQTYVDFVDWQGRMLSGPEGERLASHWRSRLLPSCPALDLPADKPRPPRKTFRGATVSASARPGLLEGIRTLARDLATTSYVVLLAGFEAMLFRLTGTEDLLVGTPTAGRSQAEFNRVVGYFVNPVPVRASVRFGMPFRELIGSVRQVVHEALDNQDYPLPLMVQASQAVRDPSRSPLFEVFFSAVSLDQIRNSAALGEDTTASPKAEPLKLAPYPLQQLEGQFDLALQITEREGSLDIELRYSNDLFELGTAQRLLAHFIAILEGALKSVDTPVEALFSEAGSGQENASVQAFLNELAARDVRLKLEGDKLRLNAPAGVLDDALKAQLASRKSELIEALRSKSAQRGQLRPVPRTGPLPLSFAQQRLWFFDRMQPGTAHYNIALILRARGRLDPGALGRSLDALMRRHESLRFCLHDDEGKARGEIKTYLGSALEVLDLAA
ncbi:MAG: condensation domain-containing protein, partial [Polyangiaceae bacterium]